MFGGGDKNQVILGGLSELMNRLGQIEESCLGSRAGMGDELGPDKNDKFLQVKYFITQDLTDYKMKIHDRYVLQKTAGASVEVISLSAQIRHLDTNLSQNLEKLKDVYRNQCDGTFFIFSRKPDQKELAERYTQLSNLASQVEEARKAWRTNQDADAGGEAPTDENRAKVLGKPSGAAAGQQQKKPKTARQGEMDEHETAAISRWQEADRQLDQEIEGVGQVVDRLRPIADEIGLQATKQEKMMGMLKSRAERASQSLRQVSIRLRQIVDTEAKSTFACRIFLILALLGLGIWIYERAKTRTSTR